MDKKNYFEAYLNKLMDKFDEIKILGGQILDDREFFCKYIWVNVKVMSCFKASEYKTKEEAEINLKLFWGIAKLLSLLTPEEFERTFPIIKEYGGEKYGVKNYFFTKSRLKEYKAGEPIIESGDIDELLFDYQNNDIRFFMLAEMECFDVLRRLEGLPSMMEEFARLEGLDTYHKYTDKNTGKEFLIDKKGKTIPLSKQRPHNLKVIQGGKR